MDENLFELMNETQTDKVVPLKKDNKKGNKKVKEEANKDVNNNVKEEVKNEVITPVVEPTPETSEQVDPAPVVEEESLKTTKFVEKLLTNTKKKKEKKELVGFRLRESTISEIDKIVEQSDLKKSEFVEAILRQALGLD